MCQLRLRMIVSSWFLWHRRWRLCCFSAVNSVGGRFFLLAATCWAWIKTCCSAQRSSHCALQLTWPRSVQPHFSFLGFYVYLLLGDIKGAKDSKAQTLISTLFVLLLLAVPSWGQGSARWRRSTSGANQEQMDRVMTPSPLEQQCNCHSKSQHVGLCTSVDLCVRRWWAGLGGHVMALRVPLIWVTDTPPTSVLWKILSFSPMISLTAPFHCAPQ